MSNVIELNKVANLIPHTAKGKRIRALCENQSRVVVPEYEVEVYRLRRIYAGWKIEKLLSEAKQAAKREFEMKQGA